MTSNISRNRKRPTRAQAADLKRRMESGMTPNQLAVDHGFDTADLLAISVGAFTDYSDTGFSTSPNSYGSSSTYDSGSSGVDASSPSSD